MAATKLNYDTCFCPICLSTNRNLYVLDSSLSDVTIRLDIFNKETSKQAVCWECRAIVRNISRFKDTASQAQKILQEWNIAEPQNTGLSRLQKTTQTEIIAITATEEEDEANSPPNLTSPTSSPKYPLPPVLLPPDPLPQLLQPLLPSLPQQSLLIPQSLPSPPFVASLSLLSLSSLPPQFCLQRPKSLPRSEPLPQPETLPPSEFLPIPESLSPPGPLPSPETLPLQESLSPPDTLPPPKSVSPPELLQPSESLPPQYLLPPESLPLPESLPVPESLLLRESLPLRQSLPPPPLVPSPPPASFQPLLPHSQPSSSSLKLNLKVTKVKKTDVAPKPVYILIEKTKTTEKTSPLSNLRRSASLIKSNTKTCIEFVAPKRMISDKMTVNVVHYANKAPITQKYKLEKKIDRDLDTKMSSAMKEKPEDTVFIYDSESDEIISIDDSDNESPVSLSCSDDSVFENEEWLNDSDLGSDSDLELIDNDNVTESPVIIEMIEKNKNKLNEEHNKGTTTINLDNPTIKSSYKRTTYSISDDFTIQKLETHNDVFDNPMKCDVTHTVNYNNNVRSPNKEPANNKNNCAKGTLKHNNDIASFNIHNFSNRTVKNAKKQDSIVKTLSDISETPAKNVDQPDKGSEQDKFRKDKKYSVQKQNIVFHQGKMSVLHLNAGVISVIAVNENDQKSIAKNIDSQVSNEMQRTENNTAHQIQVVQDEMGRDQRSIERDIKNQVSKQTQEMENNTDTIIATQIQGNQDKIDHKQRSIEKNEDNQVSNERQLIENNADTNTIPQIQVVQETKKHDQRYIENNVDSQILNKIQQIEHNTNINKTLQIRVQYNMGRVQQPITKDIDGQASNEIQRNENNAHTTIISQIQAIKDKTSDDHKFLTKNNTHIESLRRDTFTKDKPQISSEDACESPMKEFKRKPQLYFNKIVADVPWKSILDNNANFSKGKAIAPKPRKPVQESLASLKALDVVLTDHNYVHNVPWQCYVRQKINNLTKKKSKRPKKKKNQRKINELHADEDFDTTNTWKNEYINSYTGSMTENGASMSYVNIKSTSIDLGESSAGDIQNDNISSNIKVDNDTEDGNENLRYSLGLCEIKQEEIDISDIKSELTYSDSKTDTAPLTDYLNDDYNSEPGDNHPYGIKVDNYCTVLYLDKQPLAVNEDSPKCQKSAKCFDQLSEVPQDHQKETDHEKVIHTKLKEDSIPNSNTSTESAKDRVKNIILVRATRGLEDFNYCATNESIYGLGCSSAHKDGEDNLLQPICVTAWVDETYSHLIDDIENKFHNAGDAEAMDIKVENKNNKGSKFRSNTKNKRNKQRKSSKGRKYNLKKETDHEGVIITESKVDLDMNLTASIPHSNTIIESTEDKVNNMNLKTRGLDDFNECTVNEPFNNSKDTSDNKDVKDNVFQSLSFSDWINEQYNRIVNVSQNKYSSKGTKHTDIKVENNKYKRSNTRNKRKKKSSERSLNRLQKEINHEKEMFIESNIDLGMNLTVSIPYSNNISGPTENEVNNMTPVLETRGLEEVNDCTISKSVNGSENTSEHKDVKDNLQPVSLNDSANDKQNKHNPKGTEVMDIKEDNNKDKKTELWPNNADKVNTKRRSERLKINPQKEIGHEKNVLTESNVDLGINLTVSVPYPNTSTESIEDKLNNMTSVLETGGPQEFNHSIKESLDSLKDDKPKRRLIDLKKRNRKRKWPERKIKPQTQNKNNLHLENHGNFLLACESLKIELKDAKIKKSKINKKIMRESDDFIKYSMQESIIDEKLSLGLESNVSYDQNRKRIKRNNQDINGHNTQINADDDDDFLRHDFELEEHNNQNKCYSENGTYQYDLNEVPVDFIEKHLEITLDEIDESSDDEIIKKIKTDRNVFKIPSEYDTKKKTVKAKTKIMQPKEINNDMPIEINFEKLLLRPVVVLEKIESIDRLGEKEAKKQNETETNENIIAPTDFIENNRETTLDDLGEELSEEFVLTTDNIKQQPDTEHSKLVINEEEFNRFQKNNITNSNKLRLMCLYLKQYVHENKVHELREMNKNDSYFTNAMHKCLLCLQVFCSRTTLNHHMRRHVKCSGSFLCGICKFGLTNKKLLDTHLWNHRRCYKCRWCDVRYLSVLPLEHHVKYNHPQVYAMLYDQFTFGCDECNQQFYAEFVLQIPRTEERRCPNNCMEKSLNSTKNLLPERTLNSSEKNLCSAENNSSLVGNNSYLMGNNSCLVENNSSLMGNNSCLVENTSCFMENNSCSMENNSGSTKNYSFFLENASCSTENKSLATEYKSCSTENKSGNNSSLIGSDLNSSENDSVAGNYRFMENEQSISEDNKEFYCFVCDEIYTDFDTLLDHQSSTHDDRLRCIICQSAYTRYGALLAHQMRYHKQYVTPYTAKIYKENLASRKIQKSHVKIKYTCFICNHESLTYTTLLLHQKDHDLDEIYKINLGLSDNGTQNDASDNKLAQGDNLTEMIGREEMQSLIPENKTASIYMKLNDIDCFENYLCFLCNSRYANFKTLIRHQNEKHRYIISRNGLV